MKKLALVLLVATLAMALTGCNQAVHGGGQLTLMERYDDPGGGAGWWAPVGTAQFAITATCNDKKDALMSNVEWNDQTNGVQFHARLPWTSVSTASQGVYESCEEVAAGNQALDGSFAGGYINEQGQQVGQVLITLIKAGQFPPNIYGDPCQDSWGATAPSVQVLASGGTAPDNWTYEAVGCLDRGNIVWQ
jgi:hypothetical protein